MFPEGGLGEITAISVMGAKHCFFGCKTESCRGKEIPRT